MGEYDWRAEVRKRLGMKVEWVTRPSGVEWHLYDNQPVYKHEIDALYEHARETLNIPKTPPEPTDEELLDEVNTLLGTGYRPVLPRNVAVVFNEATKRGAVEVRYTAADRTWHAQVGDLDRARTGTGPTPADALRNALACWLRGEWRKKQEGGERCS